MENQNVNLLKDGEEICVNATKAKKMMDEDGWKLKPRKGDKSSKTVKAGTGQTGKVEA